jgi:high-affinity nickel-transport protein
MRAINISSLKQVRLTLLGRAIALISGELVANAVVWIAAGLAYRQAGGVLGLALLAWVS